MGSVEAWNVHRAARGTGGSSGFVEVNVERAAFVSGDVIVVVNVRSPLGDDDVKAGTHGVALREVGQGWLVRLDSGQQRVFLTSDLELLSP